MKRPGFGDALAADITFFSDVFLFGFGKPDIGALNEDGITGDSLEAGRKPVENRGERGAPAKAWRPKARRTSVLGVRTDCASLKADMSPLVLGLGEGREDGTVMDGRSWNEISAAEVSSLDR